MFSDKNYGLPKDLIEAAKRVHEKQLMEYDEDGHINNPPKGMDKGTKKDREKAAKMGLKGPHLEGEGRVTKKQKQNIPPLPVRKPKNEEVQFTEEELAEAFAIFLEENFHVEMLTEEDLDYVFENEFPQWLEEGSLADAFARPEKTGFPAQLSATMLGRRIISQSPLDAHVGLTNLARVDKRGISSREKVLKANPPTTQTNQTTGEGRPVTSGGTLPSSMVQGNAGGEYTSAPKPTAKPTAPSFPGEKALIKKENEKLMTGGLNDGDGARNPTSTAPKPAAPKPAASARKQTGGPSLFQQAKKAVRPTPGDSGRTATDRLKYMAQRGNRASQKALRGPKKDWRASAFKPRD